MLVDAIAMGTIDGPLTWLASPGDAPLPGDEGTVVTIRTVAGEDLGDLPIEAVTTTAKDEPDLTVPGDQVLVKFLRRINEGVSPEWEVGAALTAAVPACADGPRRDRVPASEPAGGDPGCAPAVCATRGRRHGVHTRRSPRAVAGG